MILKNWKKSEEFIDLEYLLALSKMSLKDSGLNVSISARDIGLILTHENPGINSFVKEAFDFSYNYLKEAHTEVSRLEFL